MSCVNKNSKEFKDTVSRLDVHPDNLEVVLHKYLNEEDRFPTDHEIMRELRAKPFEATDAEVKFYLKANHQGRKIFGSLSEATRQLNTFKTLYSGNPTIYRNSLGNYVVEAGIPMLKGVPITEGIPFAMDNTTIDQVLQSLDDTNPYHNTFRALVDVLGKENIRIGMGKLRLEDTTMKDKEGKYEDPLAVYGTEGIKFDPFNMRKYLNSNYDINDTAGRASEFRRVLLHELTHQLTRRILTSEDNTLRPEELKFKKEIERLYQEALDAIDREKFPYYGLESIEEFVAEAFSNRDFQRHLNRIKSKKRSLWNKFVGALKSLLDSLSNTSVDNSILYNIIGATSELMVYTKAERERAESERAIRDEIAEETYSELPPDDFFDNPAIRSSGGLYNKLFSLNGVRDGGYSLEKRTWSKGDYMVLNIPTYRTTLKEAIDKGYEILEKQGLSRIDYIVDDKLKEFRGSQYLNVRPRNKVEREQARIEAEKEALKKKDEREAYEEYLLELLTEEENALKGLTQEEIGFINRIEETSPILAQQVLDGLVPFDVAYDIVRNGEQTPYSPSKDTDYSNYSISSKIEGSLSKYGNFVNHSGGAVGSDSYWGEVGERYGVISKHYHAQGSKTPKGNTPVSREALLEANTHLLKANETLKRKFPTSNEYVNNLLRRNWQQVKNADEVFAISTIKNNLVEGGTGWAVQMAIDNGKPVHVFDQNTNKWYEYNAGTWIETGTPTLTVNFAGIGTRNLSESGRRAIEDVYKTTLDNYSGATIRDYSSLAKTVSTEGVTEQYGVIIDKALKRNYPTWQSNNPEGIVAYRVNFNKYNTPEEAAAGRIGNPFSEDTRGQSTVEQFFIWLTTGENFGNEKATEEYRQAILEKILNTPNNAPVLYYTELNRPSHATVLGYLINHKELLRNGTLKYSVANTQDKIQWARTASNFYEVSTQGDSRFSALKAKFKPGTIIEGVDVSGMTIENVYQSVIKKSGKGKAPSVDSIINLDRVEESGEPSWIKEELDARLPRDLWHKLYGVYAGNYEAIGKPVPEVTKADKEDFSYYIGYLPLWQEWARQNPELMQELREKSAGKVLTDKFASTRVSQARALAEILNSEEAQVNNSEIKFYEGNITPDDNTIFVFGSNPTGIHGAGAAKVAREQFGAKAGVGEGLTGNSYALPTKDLNKAKGTRWYRPSQKEEQEVKEWYKNHDYSEVINHPLNQERSIAPQQIIDSIKNLYLEASQHPDKQFKISNYPLDKISLNGYLGYEMLEMFKAAGQIPSNIVFSKTWIDTGRITKDNFINEETYTEEQETTNQEQQQIKKENQTYMENSVSITQQIDNLNSASILSATEVRHIAEQAVYWISDHITELQEKPGKAEKIYGEQFKDKDFASMSRADVVRTIGPDAMIDMCKEKFSPENTDYEDISTMDKAEIITDNWGAIMVLASDVFLNVEDFSIVSSKDGKTREVNEDLVADADNFNSSNMEGDVLENEGDLQEHWQVETKTLDVLTTMSQMVKQALTKCYLLDKDGNKITSEFGINERINVREATNSILRWTQGALNLEQMISKLQEKSDSNPWVRQIIDKLSDTSGKETDFQGQFFGTFCKHFQSYAVVIEENGKYKSIQVNENPALFEAMTQVTTQYKIGEHPLFTTEGINKEAFNELKSAFKDLEKFNHTGYDLTNAETKEEAARILGYVSNLLGYYVTPDMVAENLNKETFKKMYSALNYITRSLEENLDNAAYEPFKFKSKDGINGNTREFLKPITDHLEDTAVSAFYDSGKMYQSYITPSYTSKLFQKFSQTGKTFDDFLMEEYGKVPWFHTGTRIEVGWRNAWLQKLATDSNARKIFKHKVQLNFNKHNYMKNMSDMEHTLSVLTEYFSENASEKQARVPAWFRVPMLSNKPSSEFIRFYSERGTNYKETLTNGFKMIFDQELSRIQTVEMRNLSKEDPRFIKNFDTNGKKFMFLDFMNAYLTGDKKSSELGKLIRQKLDGHKVDEIRLNELAKEAIMQTMENRAEFIVANWEAQGILKGAEKIANIGTSEEEIRENLINFVWNDTFAAMNIMQLTITDIAFYKDAEDLQKRLAQIHAPGVRGNVKATDYEGKPVTDGNFRTIKLTDFDSFISNIIDNVSVVFDRKIANAPESEKKALRALKESLVGEDGAFRQINVADAQGYSSPTSYRKKAFIFSKWSRKSEEVYQKLRSGTYTYKDLKIAFQPLKPLVYSQITKDAGIEGAPLNSLKVPVQFKNSEYLLIMADAILQNENTGRPNLLRAIFNVMEESHYDKDGNYKTDGIDTVQFESTVKSGLMGRINLNDLVEDPNGETIAKVRMESAIYDSEGAYNNTYVDTVPFEDYCLQQEVPEHFKDHAQVHGSQLRYIIVSELDNFNYFGEPVTYNLEGKQVTAEEFKAEYENTIAENIQDSINELFEELGLNSFSTKDRNIALSKILQKEILSSPRYGIDLLQACSVDENGRFRIPLGDPIQSKRVEQLINSVIKNRINKQKIAGGPVVQVTNFGTSKELNIRFKDKEGNLLMTRAEYEKNPIRKEVSQSDKFNARYKKGNKTSSNVVSYEDYIKENQAGIAYFEVFAPIYSNQLFTQFADKNGVINIQAIEMLDPDLLKMIGYRIPTEDKYSMAPLKIVGFLPREAGDGIMLPNDITLLTGSDFDIDKEYLMRKEYSIKKSNTKRGDIHRILYDELVSSQKGPLSYDTKVGLHDLVDQFLEDPFDSSSLVNQKTAKGYMTMPKGAYNKMLKIYMQNMYTVEKPTEGRTYRNNKIVDMTYEVLTHETSAEKMLNPGGFDPQRKMGYLVSAYKKYSYKYTWEQLQDMSISELKDLDNSNKNLSYIDTHIQFYKQNSAAGSLIGIFAVNRTAHAVLESGTPDGSAEYLMNVDNVCKISKVFTVAGMEFGGNMPFDMRYDRNGQLIGKTLGSLVAASADAVKDPVLNLMNINSNTASILTTLVRFGMSFNDAALFLSQSVISEVLADFSRENITGYTSLSKVIQKKLDQLRKDANISESSELNNEELTYEELVEGLKPDAKPEIAYKTLLAFSNFQKMAGAIRMPTFATRFNSMSSAVGPLIIDNLITEHEMEKLSLESNILDKNLNPVDMNSVFMKHPILGQFQSTVGIARQLFGNMPANSTGFRNILSLISESSLSNTIFKDRKLLSSLSDFYQSYLVMKNRVINPRELGSTITEFTKEFMKKEYKKKYADNALIQAIKYGTDKSGRLTLQVDISGLDTQQKEKLSSAWIDLHKMDPELSIKLFKYNFFRGGIGFSPKTFMSLVPVYVKERIPNYIDTFRVLPTVVPEIVLDQFIRNNWDNNKLVPRKKVTFEQLPNGNMKISKPSEVEDLTGVTYFKTKINNEDKLFMQVLEGDGTIEVMEITPLGSNKEYIEMSETSIDSPLNIPTEAKVEVSESEVGKQSELGESETSAETEDSLGNIKDTYRLEDLLYRALVIEGTRNREQAEDYVKNFKSKTAEEKAALEKGTKKFLKARFEKLNIKFDEKLIDDVYKLIC